MSFVSSENLKKRERERERERVSMCFVKIRINVLNVWQVGIFSRFV